jgi:protoporphyrinogen IX oxidase
MIWLKALHLISMVAWFAGLFYLPRLFVYHAEATDSISIQRFKIMERRLYKGIMTPAMLATLVFGGSLLYLGWPAYKTMGWMHTKLLLIVLLIGYHHACGAMMKKFARDANTRSSKFYRWFNEVPTVLLVGIVVLAVVRPY